MSRSWLYLLAPAAVVCAVFLAVMIQRLIQTVRSSEVIGVPLDVDQVVELPMTGRILLHGEGPRGSRTFAGLDYVLRPAEGGQAVPLRPVRVKSTTSGWSSARVSLHSFELHTPGRYALHVEGIGDGLVTDGHRIVFSMDARAAMVLEIVLIVALGLGFVGSAILTAIVFVQTGT